MTDQAIASAAGTPSVGEYLKNNLREYGLLFALIVVIIFFQVATGGRILTSQNVTNIILQNSYIIVMALGMLLVIVAGHIDLSVGSIVGFTGAVAAVLMSWHGWPVLPAALAAVATGALIGAIQGYFVAYIKIPSFIVTLAGMLVFRGLTLAILQGQAVGSFPDAFSIPAIGYLPDPLSEPGKFRMMTLLIGIALAAIFTIMDYRARLERQRHGVEEEPYNVFVVRNLLVIGATVFASYLLAGNRGIPNVLVIMLALVLLYAFVTTRTVIGRRVYALGGNEKAAKLSGVRTEWLTFLAFINMGVLSALAGMIFAARASSAQPKGGDTFELDVIAACFIGGASASGGVGKVTGAVIGALLMGVMNNGMSLMNLGIDYQKVVKGIVLLLAVWLDVYYKKK